ncbi:MAG: phosphoenolpyruvate synthase [Candidatus Levybacteria bacterium RIFCSPHIGHO2_12_FULL_38_12]|nr:MAG: phosphoenolpyruvate synthase [Candidatus Levybacteria bacterium RIFCSPHIGHO2_01_FULL_38_12]OGH22455.1 MAG: phosphoenolpyruvate synthase [Candidatus Levybacteria bacterium RIFCSPHIGHO2_12_FULL_38_12]OGH44364.1 MAG: phosphoenolpyruvate synthase [Candidatus Levybacteria bacterium RIFCSPLOWO2_02_FULL_37_18]
MSNGLVLWFSEVGKDDIALVGGKGANLGEMTGAGFPVPDGFIVTSKAYYQFLRENNLVTKIKHLIGSANFENHDSLTQTASHIQKLIINGKMSDVLIKEIFSSYRKLGGVLKDAFVAVRSSATAEDLPNASFAGQQSTFLNVKGEANVLIKIKEAWASLFEARAIFYRHEKKFDHFKIGIAVPVQKMVESEKSGVMFTIDPITNDKSKIIIEAIYGLGEYIVGGTVTPDHYEILKKDLTLISKNVATQSILLKRVKTINKKVFIPKKTGQKQKLSVKEIEEIASYGKKLEKHYYFPQDVEWAIEKNEMYIVQTRPVTTIHPQKEQKKHDRELKELPLLLKGQPASPGISTGTVKILKSAKEIHKIEKGDVLVAAQTNPDYVPAMKKASAIVTDSGGRTSHAAIVSRELGIPAVVGTGEATKKLKLGMTITVNGTKGEVFKGEISLPSSAENKVEDVRIRTKTKVYVNLAQSELADTIAQKHVDGVGLLRAEFIMAGIGTHPKKLIRDGKKNVFIQKMAESLIQFCQPFNPRPVVYRTSDFKTNEYRQLIGGKDFEPEEANPMLGYRGAFRYIHDPEVFELELEAIKIVRNKKGLKNVWIMIPFVRTVKELIEVKKIISRAGLYRSDSFKLWMMVEIPSNVILLEKFIQVGIDGVSIGSNDLTMLIIGTDRDNNEVASEFNEQNEAVLWALEHVIKTSHKYRVTTSICGQAPSQYPELVEKLIGWGITSVSISPDAIEHVRRIVSECEKKLIL